MQTTDFKKAAKRLSLDQSLALNEAQEKLAAYFGYANFFAALQSIEKMGARPNRTVEKISASTDKPDLFLTNDAGTIIKWGIAVFTNFWEPGAINLWRGLVPALCWLRDHEGVEISIRTFVDYLALTKLEELYAKGYTLGKQSPTGQWPEAFEGLKSYLEVGLPGFKFERALKKHGALPKTPGPGGKLEPLNQDDAVIGVHGYWVVQLNHVLKAAPVKPSTPIAHKLFWNELNYPQFKVLLYFFKKSGLFDGSDDMWKQRAFSLVAVIVKVANEHEEAKTLLKDASLDNAISVLEKTKSATLGQYLETVPGYKQNKIDDVYRDQYGFRLTMAKELFFANLSAIEAHGLSRFLVMDKSLKESIQELISRSSLPTQQHINSFVSELERVRLFDES